VTYSNDLRHLQPSLARRIEALPNFVNWKWLKKDNGEWTKPPLQIDIAQQESRH
jgi:hypothetical protein